jgi:hypothetical protein
MFLREGSLVHHQLMRYETASGTSAPSGAVHTDARNEVGIPAWLNPAARGNIVLGRLSCISQLLFADRRPRGLLK